MKEGECNSPARLARMTSTTFCAREAAMSPDGNAGYTVSDLIPLQGRAADVDRKFRAIAIRKAITIRGQGGTFETMVQTMADDLEIGIWARTKGAANNQRELRRIWDRAIPEKADPRPVIRLAPGKLAKIADEAEQALKASGKPVFQRDTVLVQPIRMEVPATGGRTTIAAGLGQLQVPGWLDLMSQVARFEKFDKRSDDWLPADPPDKVAAVHLSRVGRWSFLHIAGVVTAPTLRPNGTVLTAPGYDPETRLFHMPDDTLCIDGLLDHPTRHDAEAALEKLNKLLTEFPFVDEVSRSVALSMLITPVVRGGLSVTPLHAIKANTAGTGKSYLVDLASVIATGRPCPVVAAGPDEAETEKRLIGMLLRACPIISIDNVNGELGGDTLCQATERPLISVRPLGGSGILEIESRACINATGNALRVRGDMVRRSLVAALDAGVERPELREFSFDPVADVLADRSSYVAACLIICRAYILAGYPNPCRALASFQDWSRVVRSALVWLDCEDPCRSMEAARADDPELTEMREILMLWHQAFGEEGKTVRDVADDACSRAHTVMGEPTEFSHPELRDALLRVAGDKGNINTRRLGEWLKNHEGRIVSSLKVRRVGEAKGGVTRWAVRS
jgi:putative DNA primase/helicase